MTPLFSQPAHAQFLPTPDHGPLAIRFEQPPQVRADRNLLLSYRVTPISGLAEVIAVVTLDARASDYLPTSDRSQEIPLPLPPATTVGRLTAPITLVEHPWAGAPVFIRLVAVNSKGERAESAPVSLVLPAQPFTNPVAVELLKLRALLYSAPELRLYVRRSLWRMLHSPDTLPNDPTVVLALGMARIYLAPEEPVIRQGEVLQILWDTARHLEARYGATIPVPPAPVAPSFR